MAGETHDPAPSREYRAGVGQLVVVHLRVGLTVAVVLLLAVSVALPSPLDLSLLGSRAVVVLALVAIYVPAAVLHDLSTSLAPRHGSLLRPRVTLTDQGALWDGRLASWDSVTGVTAYRRAFSRRVALTLRGGGTALLPAPIDTRLVGPSPRFTRQLAEIRRYARRHGAGTDAPSPHRRRYAVLVGATATAVFAGALYVVTTRTVVPPWALTASALPAKCPAALERAGLSWYWPPYARWASAGASSGAGGVWYHHSCGWAADPHHTRTSPYREVRLKLTLHPTGFGESGIGDATRQFGAAAGAAVFLPPADQAVLKLRREGRLVTVTARRGNVVIMLTLKLNSGATSTTPDMARSAAQRLAAGVLNQIRFE